MAGEPVNREAERFWTLSEPYRLLHVATTDATVATEQHDQLIDALAAQDRALCLRVLARHRRETHEAALTIHASDRGALRGSPRDDGDRSCPGGRYPYPVRAGAVSSSRAASRPAPRETADMTSWNTAWARSAGQSSGRHQRGSIGSRRTSSSQWCPSTSCRVSGSGPPAAGPSRHWWMKWR